MTILPSPDIYGYTVFCDDVRQELGGKTSFIGVYSDTMLVHGEFPLTLPKFGFGISLLQRREIFEANVEVQIFLPGDGEESPSIALQGSEAVEGAVAAQTAAQVEGLPKGDERIIAMHLNVIAAPLIFKEPGIMKVRGALRRGDVIRLGSIRIVSQPQAPTAPTP
jgi:hypothetical protein